ncbi:P-loop ATPase, Sll1717 family [Paenibacillus sp. S28]|uniref:P-loop ATPase, Sll1717 family n=1 Tax=Paenibacillus sp. S28 TaxID=2767463 RepID=UPI00190CA817|nr:hypothetical protein [Paenibacillus sp. S28]MBJ9991748.1 hypothetical protein [Paenibacillus sp. S28]
MKKVLELSDLYLGNLDAKHELLGNTEEERFRFETSFLVPENVNIDNFLAGRLFYITGLKGTGKTALMRYIGIYAEKSIGAVNSFVLFKTQFNEDDKKDLARAARTTIVEQEEIPDEQDFEAIWRWFLHRHIVLQIEKNELNVFERNRDWDKYVACVTAPNMGDEVSGIRRFFPKVKKGTVEVSAEFHAIQGKLGLELDFEDREQKRVKFNPIVRQAEALFEKLIPSDTHLNIFVDELEISFMTQKSFDRDARMVRDLILAVESMNLLFKQQRANIKIICGVRSEVISSISTVGKEINKPLGDFGINIMWNQSGGDITQHPILKMIVKRLITSEQHHGIYRDNPEEVWKSWFPEQVQETDTPKYLLHHTWYRPRDIVRLLNLAQKEYPRKESFDHQTFDAIRRQYSIESWVEMTEELRATYRQEEIEVIRRLLYGFKPYFTFGEVKDRVRKLNVLYDDVQETIDKLRLNRILSHLFKIGIIGNVLPNGKQRWAYRGDTDLLLEEKMTVHRALWNDLGLG